MSSTVRRDPTSSRTGSDIIYRPGAAAFALFDCDAKGMPADVSARLNESGGFWPTLVSLFPELARVARVQRRSTSVGLYHTDTGDTVAACPPLSLLEQQKLKEMCAKEAHRLAPEIAKARERFIDRQSQQLVDGRGINPIRARAIVERQCSGVLLPDIVLPFDDAELANTTVADVLADPCRFEGATLADPLEGREYGVCKARIMRRADGTPWIHSFAHGRTIYELKYDARSVEGALSKAPVDEVAELFVRLVVAADVDADEIERLRDLVSNFGGLSKRAINAKLKRAQQAHAARQAGEERQRRLVERCDPRPHLDAPLPDAERLPIVTAIDDVLAGLALGEPPIRDAQGRPTEVRECIPIMLHALLERDIDVNEIDPTAGSGDAFADAA
jgi:hypothetical protein